MPALQQIPSELGMTWVGDWETWRLGDWEIGGVSDLGTRRLGDWGFGF